MASESVSPFVLQKIRERQALKEPDEEPEEVEEEDEEDEEEEERDELPEPPAKKSHHAIGERSSHRARGGSLFGGSRGGASLTDRATKFFKQLGPTQSMLLIGGGLLVVNHLMVPRGTSVISQILNAIAPAPKKTVRRYYAGVRAPISGPPPPDPSGCGPGTMWDAGKQTCVPVLPWPIQQASGDFAGANWGAGWNRGNKPFGPWAHAAPGGPSPYAHADLGWW
jgi:hypothetical protein